MALLVPALLYALVFLLMPFGVLGLKGRLDGIEARLDELHSELRTLTLRLPEARRGPEHFDPYELPPPPRAPARPPIAPSRAAPSRFSPNRAESFGGEPGRDAPPRPAPRAEPGFAAAPDDDVPEIAPPAPNEAPRRRVTPVGRAEPRVDWPR